MVRKQSVSLSGHISDGLFVVLVRANRFAPMRTHEDTLKWRTGELSMWTELLVEVFFWSPQIWCGSGHGARADASLRWGFHEKYLRENFQLRDFAPNRTWLSAEALREIKWENQVHTFMSLNLNDFDKEKYFVTWFHSLHWLSGKWFIQLTFLEEAGRMIMCLWRPMSGAKHHSFSSPSSSDASHRRKVIRSPSTLSLHVILLP